MDETTTTVETAEDGVLTQVLNGAQKQYGFMDGGFSTFLERIGGFASVAVPAVVLNDRFRIKPALNALPAAQREAAISNIALGSLTIGA